MGPQAGSDWGYGAWGAVLMSVLLFGFFVWGGLRPRRRREWRSLGVVSAFIVALFAEMYGFPLTIYVVSSTVWPALGGSGAFGHIDGHLLGSLLGLPTAGKLLICMIGGLVAMYGIILMWSAWRRVHAADAGLVTDGPYAAVRHPQYSGLGLFIVGMLIQWPTLLTLAMAPLLLLRYLRLARIEEREMEEAFPISYPAYRLAVPAFFPRARTRRAPAPVTAATALEEDPHAGR